MRFPALRSLCWRLLALAVATTLVLQSAPQAASQTVSPAAKPASAAAAAPAAAAPVAAAPVASSATSVAASSAPKPKPPVKLDDIFAPAPTRAEMLRGAYGPFRANNDLLYYHLDIRVDPVKAVDQRQEHDSLQDAQGWHAHSARPARDARHRQDSLGRDSAQVRARLGRGLRGFSRRHCAPARSIPSIFITPAIPRRSAASAA